MNNINTIYDSMFALRVTLELDNVNELNIIKEFKKYLTDMDYPISEFTNIIYNFYINNNINTISKHYIDSIELVESPIRIMRIEYFIFALLNEELLDNVSVTLDDKEFDKLNKIILSENLDKTCNICLEDMIINDKIIKLGCEHCFHENCIIPYLKKYNYICPICKYEIGEKKYNTDSY